MSNIKYTLLILTAIFFFVACKDDDAPTETITIDETPYVLEYGALPAPTLPADNPLTVQGVQLGRMLFFEKLMCIEVFGYFENCDLLDIWRFTVCWRPQT